MPKCHSLHRRGPIHHPSAHPDTKIRRRLERLSKKHKGSMVRLASQSQPFAAPTPRQDRFFAAALIENWCHHLLYNGALYGHQDLLPRIPLPSVQWLQLKAQLALWKDVEIDHSSASFYTGQNFWPPIEAEATSALLPVRRYDGRSLAWLKKTLLRQGAQLGLLTRQKVNYLNLVDDNKAKAHSFLLAQIRETLPLLSKTKKSLDLILPTIAATPLRREVFLQAWQNLQKWSEQAETVRLVIDGSDLIDFLPVISAQGKLSLDKRSRIMVIISEINPPIKKMLSQGEQIAAQFGLEAERLTWLWLQPEANIAIFSCRQGHFHWPIYYRLISENERLYICNPLAANYPVLYYKFKGKIAPPRACPCGFSAPSIELD